MLLYVDDAGQERREVNGLEGGTRPLAQGLSRLATPGGLALVSLERVWRLSLVDQLEFMAYGPTLDFAMITILSLLLW